MAVGIWFTITNTDAYFFMYNFKCCFSVLDLIKLNEYELTKCEVPCIIITHECVVFHNYTWHHTKLPWRNKLCYFLNCVLSGIMDILLNHRKEQIGTMVSCGSAWNWRPSKEDANGESCKPLHKRSIPIKDNTHYWHKNWLLQRLGQTLRAICSWSGADWPASNW